MNPANSGSGKQQPSFQTNVNRAKTKRWVEAKSYSYDGDDWGDDEYDEYDPSPPPPPPPPAAARTTGLRKPSQGVPSPTSEPSSGRLPSSTRQSPVQQHDMPRGRSPPARSPSLQEIPSRSVTSPPVEASSNEAPDSSNSSKPLPFIRPADIYKRMEEERSREQPPQDSNRPSEGAVADKDFTHVSDLESVPQVAGNTAPSQLPEVQTGSTFGADFLSGTGENQSPPAAHSADAEIDNPERPDLHHNPSLGFRSVVHQAFDTPTNQETPQTPNSSADTVTRSDSEGTSVISPIISSNLLAGNTESHTPDETKTPTIAEEPNNELGAEKATPGNQTPEFKPGHRRDFSTPSPGNSPARQPVVSTNDHLAEPEIGDLSTTPSSDLSARAVDPESPALENMNAKVAEQEVTPASPDGSSTPRPIIRTSSPLEPLRPLETRGIHYDHNEHAEIDGSLPTMSTDTSPQDTESDRLRKEIVRSLSPQPAFDRSESSTPLESRSRIRQESTLIPSEYDSYWNDSSFHQTAGGEQGENPNAVSASPVVASNKALPTVPDPATETSAETSETKLAHRRNFSWEDLGRADSLPGEGANNVDHPGVRAAEHSTTSEISPHPDPRGTNANSGSASPDGIGKDSSEQGGLAIVPPNPEIEVSPESSNVGLAHPPQSADSLGAGQDTTTRNAGLYPSAQTVKPVQSSSDPRVPGFREILLLKTPNERIHMFNDAREQFAATDPGLEHWLRVTIQTLPEHSDLVGLQERIPTNTSAHRPTPSRNKFPKLPASFTNLALQTSSGQDNSPQASTPTHGRNPSASGFGNVISGQQVQAKGKDFLHSAGVLGGKAGGAAKGLLAKSRSRFRGSGNDKVFLPSPVSGSYQTLPPASSDTYSTQNGSAWPQRSYSLRQHRHLSTMSMGDTTASLPSISGSINTPGHPTSVSVPRSNGNGAPARNSPLPDMNEGHAAHPPNYAAETIAGAQGTSTNVTTLPLSESDDYGNSTLLRATSAAPVLDIDIASPSIGEKVFFTQPENTEGQPSPSYQVTESSHKRGSSNVSTSHSTTISLANSHLSGISESTQETLSIADEKNQRNPPESHRNTRNNELPSYQAFERQIDHTQQLTEGNPQLNHRRRFSFEDDDEHEDEPALENSHTDQQRHVYNQVSLAGTEQRDEKRGVGGYPSSTSPPPAPPYSDHSHSAPYTAPVAPQHNETFVQTPSQYTTYNSVNHTHNQSGNAPILHNAPGQTPSGISTQADEYSPQYGTPGSYAYNNEPVGQVSSSTPVFPPYRTNSWVSTWPQHQTATYSSAEVVHPSYPTSGAVYTPNAQSHGGWTTTPQIQPDPPSGRSGYLDASHPAGGSHRSESLARPDSDSQKSGESMVVNAAASRTDLPQQDKADGVARKGDIGKVKMRNKLQRASTSRDPTNNTDNTMKKSFAKLSGLFGRSSTSASPRRAPFVPKLSSPSEQPQQQRSHTFDESSGHPQLSASNRAQTFAGEEPPIGGYYAPDSPLDEPDDEIDEISALERSATSAGSNHGSYPGQTSQGTSPTYRVSPASISRSSERQARWDSTRSHTQNLHMRSRSPRPHPPRPQEYIEPPDDPDDPASNLGTFSSVVPATPRVGDQERPWNITLPDDGRPSEDTRPLSYIPQKLNSRARHQGHQHTPTSNHPVQELSSVDSPAQEVPPPLSQKQPDPAPAIVSSNEMHTHHASRPRGPPLVVVPPVGEHRDVTPARNVGENAPVELPVSGDTSDDEIVMSSTAYPGQEWQPSNLGHWD